MAAWVRGTKHLFLLLVLSLPFQAAVMVEFDLLEQRRGVSLRYFIMAVFCLSLLTRPAGKPPGMRRLRSLFVITSLFVTYSVLSAFIIPRLAVFSGSLLVYRENGVFSALEPVSTNYTHILNLCLCVATFFCTSLVAMALDRDWQTWAVRALGVSGALAVVLLLWHLLNLYLGWWFPYYFFANNPGAMLVDRGTVRPDLGRAYAFLRPSGSFSEPSVAAPMLCGYLAYVMAEYLHLRRVAVHLLKCTLVCAVIFALTSTTAYAAALMIVIYSLLRGIAKMLMKAQVAALTRPVLLVAVVMVCFLVVYLSPSLAVHTSEMLRANVTDKVGADAGNRIALERFAIGLAVETYGFGAGLGSNVSFTVWGYLLSNTGLIGVILMFCLGMKVYGHYNRWRKCATSVGDGHNVRLVGAMLCGFVVAGSIGSQILFEPALWVLLGLIVGLCGQRNAVTPRSLRRISPRLAPTLEQDPVRRLGDDWLRSAAFHG
ncbi:MAG: hypothetical protein AAB654_06865 [Acidobacteriota bacterium]